jgi:DNA polymerase III epsilon subunit-like protein
MKISGYFSIDVETTGLNHRIHELIQICILPLNDDFEALEVEPFYTQIKAELPENSEKEALEVCQLDPTVGLSRKYAKLNFVVWINMLQDKYGFEKIIPVGQNYAGFDKDFIIDWLGFDFYHKNFSRTVRDTKYNGGFFADVMQKEFLNGLKDQAEAFGINNVKHHDALNDTLVTAQIYKKHVEALRAKLNGADLFDPEKGGILI